MESQLWRNFYFFPFFDCSGNPVHFLSICHFSVCHITILGLCRIYCAQNLPCLLISMPSRNGLGSKSCLQLCARSQVWQSGWQPVRVRSAPSPLPICNPKLESTASISMGKVSSWLSPAASGRAGRCGYLWVSTSAHSQLTISLALPACRRALWKVRNQAGTAKSPATDIILLYREEQN